jgi:hypothetical protein
LLFVAAGFVPLHIYGANPIGIGRPERILVYVGLIWIAGMFLVWLLSESGMSIMAAENTVFLTVALVMGGGPVMSDLGIPGAIVVLVCLPILAGFVFQRFQDHWLVSALVVMLATAAAAGPLLALVDTLREEGGPSVVRPVEDFSIEMEITPDTYLVVLDGYPGELAIAQDGLDGGEFDAARELEKRGFSLPVSWSSYWTTTLSIPSLLAMGYPVESADWTGLSTVARLQKLISGDNPTVKAFEDNGYTSHMIESGWSGSSCGADYDKCVPSPLMDDATYLILHRTVTRPLLRNTRGPFAIGTLAGFDWLLDNAEGLSSNGRPDFVFMHVVSPHSPYLLASDCSFRLGAEAEGPQVIDRELPEQRTAPLMQQMDCLESLMVRLADALHPDDILVFVSDHGPGRRGQAVPSETEWDREAIIERMNNFLAFRTPRDCSIDDGVVVPNVMRHLFACMSDDEVDLVPKRMWINPMVELTHETVLMLTGLTAAAD